MAEKLPINQVLSEQEIISRSKRDYTTNIDGIREYLNEFIRAFATNRASPAETLTLHRAYPDNKDYEKAVANRGILANPPLVVGGSASVSVKDNQGHVVTEDALRRSFDDFMNNDRMRNVILFHSDIQIGWALPCYICKDGTILKSGVRDGSLYLISEIADKPQTETTRSMIRKGGLKSYSIGGTIELDDPNAVQAVKQNGKITKIIHNMRMTEVSIAMKGVNDHTQFKILKSKKRFSENQSKAIHDMWENLRRGG